VAEAIDGKRLKIIFCQLYFLEKSIISPLETEAEEEVNSLRVEINRSKELLGLKMEH